MHRASVASSWGAGQSSRGVRTDVVEQLDRALTATGGEVTHALDPRRMVRFEDGGPAVWSVGIASLPGGVRQLLTYGLSRAVDPTSPFGFELAIRIADAGDPMWAVLLLRGLARYQRGSRREIRVGQFMALDASITRAMVAPAERGALIDGPLDTVAMLPGATLPSAAGPIEIRNVYGLDPRGRELLETVSSARFAQRLLAESPTLTVDPRGESLASSDAFAQAVRAASAGEPSDCGSCAIPGLRWSRAAEGFVLQIPAGHAPRVRAMFQARLPFGQPLTVHAVEQGPGTAVLFRAPDASGPRVAAADPDCLIVAADPRQLATPMMFWSRDAVRWTLR